MLPVNTITLYPIQTPLINTAVPGSSITHVPYDNVAPSVSSAQTDPNARGNSDGAAANPPPVTTDTVDSEATESPASTPSNLAPGAQATFLAQLIGQDTSVSPETQGVLVQYERLVQISDVKYKPSNASKPAPAPAGVFGRILQQEKAAAAPRPVPVPAANPAPAPVTEETAPVMALPQAPKAASPAPARKQTEGNAASEADISSLSSQAISAYTATAVRPDAAVNHIDNLAA